MNEKPILFSTEMVRAILEGRKTQTRRIIKSGDIYVNDYNNHWPFVITEEGWEEKPCPYGEVGNLLWVRETWQKIEGNRIIYKANTLIWGGNWKPSIFMPKAAARIWLEITNVRVERLNDISHKDAVAEISTPGWPLNEMVDHISKLKDEYKHHALPTATLYQLGFIRAWANINGLSSWFDNPWVWVIEFKLISKTGKPCKH